MQIEKLEAEREKVTNEFSENKFGDLQFKCQTLSGKIELLENEKAELEQSIKAKIRENEDLKGLNLEFQKKFFSTTGKYFSCKMFLLLRVYFSHNNL